jgi:hypothetical protein
MLAMQMAAVHETTMMVARRLDRSENMIELDSTEHAFNKLTRTFASQMEALTRYRAGAEQMVTLQQVPSLMAARPSAFAQRKHIRDVVQQARTSSARRATMNTSVTSLSVCWL